jgi:hypothetical protein
VALDVSNMADVCSVESWRDLKVIMYKGNFDSIYLDIVVTVVADCFQSWGLSVSCRMLR